MHSLSSNACHLLSPSRRSMEPCTHLGQLLHCLWVIWENVAHRTLHSCPHYPPIVHVLPHVLNTWGLSTSLICCGR